MGEKMKIFLPSPDAAYKACNVAWWNNGFSDEEIDAICEMGERLPFTSGQIGTNEGGYNSEYRQSLISWINTEGWLADKIEFIARQLNGEFFGLDLWGFGEPFQYTIYKYDKDNAGHYDWHMDKGESKGAPRKLSMVLQLSDPSEYDGGDLQIMTGVDLQIAKKEKGIIYAFPSYVMHRVTPVTRGTRRTLVVWISGPRFK